MFDTRNLFILTVSFMCEEKNSDSDVWHLSYFLQNFVL